jgi:hypothetical protein
LTGKFFPSALLSLSRTLGWALLGFAMGEGPRLCAICDDPAVWFCPADDAFLCGDCDEQIHGANWLARKHQRMAVSHRGSPRRDLELGWQRGILHHGSLHHPVPAG